MSTLAKVWVFHLLDGKQVRFEFVAPVHGATALANFKRAGYSKTDIANVTSEEIGNCAICGTRRMALCYQKAR